MLGQARSGRSHDLGLDGRVAAQSFIEALGEPVEYKLDEPSDPAGEWWIDFSIKGIAVNVAWRPNKGFGIYVSDENAYGTGPDEVYRSPKVAARRLMQVVFPPPGRKPGAFLRLKDIRKIVDQPQTSVAERMHVGQSVISRLEKQSDVRLSTINQYVEALGGKLKVMVCFDDFEAPIEMSAQDDPLPTP